MSKIQSFNANGETAGEVDFADDLLVLDKGDQAVKDVVVATLAASRAGTASTLSKGEVSGSNKKLWKQKGTGRARTGFRQSPVWRGGGIAMGPKPRDFSLKVNKKVAKLAFAHAVSSQIAEGKVVVVEALPTDGKTKTMAAFLDKIGAKDRVLVVLDKNSEDAIWLALRNIHSVLDMVIDSQLDVYTLLAAKKVVVTKAALDGLMARMKKPEVAE